jgi:folate-dependent tRNA-U54 methylase TrmFO/GidA
VSANSGRSPIGRKRVKSSLNNIRSAQMNGALTPSGERKERSGRFATANRHGLEIETPPPTTAIGACVNYITGHIESIDASPRWST